MGNAFALLPLPTDKCPSLFLFFRLTPFPQENRTMKIKIKQAKLLPIVLLSFYCELQANVCPAEGNRPVTGLEAYEINDKQLPLVIAKANKGDREAAYKLYLHFDAAKGDVKSGKPWLIRSANAGCPPAQYTLGVLLFDNPPTRNEGITWVKKAAANGDTAAKNMLAWLAEKEKKRQK